MTILKSGQIFRVIAVGLDMPLHDDKSIHFEFLQESIMQMLTTSSDAVKQYLARLYNAIASLCVGE